MTHETGLAQILLAGAAAFCLILLRQLRTPQPRHYRWHRKNDLVSTGGLALLFAAFAAVFAGVVPAAVGIPLVVALLVAWLAGSSYTSRKASEEGRALVEEIMAGKFDKGGF